MVSCVPINSIDAGHVNKCFIHVGEHQYRGGGGEGTPYDGQYRKALSGFRYMKGISLLKVYKRGGKSVIWGCKWA